MLKATITRVNKWAATVAPQKFFLAVGAPVALVLCFLTPPFMVPDEPAHFFRAYQIAQGGFLPERITQGVGGILPRSLNDTSTVLVGDLPGQFNNKMDVSVAFDELNRPLRPQETMHLHFENTALYSPLVYAPSAVGIAIGKLFEPSPLLLFYLGRLFTVAAWIGLAYLAIRLVPVAKWAFTVIALAPMALFQSASVSADALTLAAGFVVVAWFLRLMHADSTMSKRDMAVTIGLVALLGFIKQPYALLGGLFLLVPAARFTAKKIRWQFVAAVGAVLGATTLLWASISRSFFTQSPFMVDRVLQPNEQIAHILGHPLAFAKAVIFTHFTGMSDSAIQQMLGVFGWLDTALPLWAMLLYLAVLVSAVGLAHSERIRLPVFHRLVFLGIAAAVVLAIDVLLYLYWNPLGSTIIGGIQGRYYLPLLPLLAYACVGLYGVTFKHVKPQLIIMPGVVVVLLAMLALLVQRFY